MASRPEAGGGYGLPNEYHNYGDRESETWLDHDRGDRRSPRRADVDRDAHDWLCREWSEVPRFAANDRVIARGAVGGGLFKNVPGGTQGRVVSTRSGLLTEYATVEFDNGYTEEVKTSQLDTVRSWF